MNILDEIKQMAPYKMGHMDGFRDGVLAERGLTDELIKALRAFEHAFKDAKIECEGLANTMNLGYAIDLAKVVLEKVAARDKQEVAVPTERIEQAVDAERYRWLKTFRPHSPIIAIHADQAQGDIVLCHDDLDAAIDAAMKDK